MLNVKDWLKDTTKLFSDVGIDSPRLDALLLLEHVSGIDKSKLLAIDQIKINENKLKKAVQRRTKREPLAYITKTKDFYGHIFYIDKNVLIPRPETEVLVEFITTHTNVQSSLLDIGTGSGAIAVASKLARPDLDVYASDISQKALKVARRNATALGAEVTFMRSNLLNSAQQRFDVIAANLPYLDPKNPLQAEVSFEPSRALFSKDKGLRHIRSLARQINATPPRDWLVIEHDDTQNKAIAELFADSKLKLISVSKFVTAIEF